MGGPGADLLAVYLEKCYRLDWGGVGGTCAVDFNLGLKPQAFVFGGLPGAPQRGWAGGGGTAGMLLCRLSTPRLHSRSLPGQHSKSGGPARRPLSLHMYF